MHQLTPHSVWLGNAVEARDARGVIENTFDVVIDLAYEELPAALPREITYCRFPLLDGEDNPEWLLRAALTTTATFLQMQKRMLIACGAGMSRSPAVAAVALSLFTPDSAEKWLQRISEQSSCDVLPGLWHDLERVAESIPISSSEG